MPAQWNTHRPKVLFLHQGGELYGSDIIFYQIVRALSPLVEPVIVLDGAGPLAEKLKEFSDTIIIRNLGVIRRKYFSVTGLLKLIFLVMSSGWWLVKYIKRQNIKLVYTNTIVVLPGALAAKITGRPHIWHIHEIVEKPDFLGRFFSVLVQSLSTRIIAVSGATVASLTRGWPGRSNKIEVIYNSLAVTPYDAAPQGKFRQAQSLAEDIFLVGLIGRIQPRKGHDVLVESAHCLLQQGLNFRVIIVGDIFKGYEDYLAQLKQKIKIYGLEQHILFCGYRQDTPEIVKDLDVVVVPSLLPESFGLVALEAMACAKPVIATAHGGVVEIIKDNETGFLIPPDKTEPLTDLLIKLAADKTLCRRVGESGRTRMEEMFAPERFTRQVQKAVQTVLTTFMRDDTQA